MALEAGKIIGQNLKLLRELGKGAMGSVWAAEHLTLHRQVAVKFMSRVLMESEISVERFEREATAAAQIASPHVAHIYDHGTTGEGERYIVMELLVGEDLSARCKRLGPLPLREVAHIVVQLCKALGKAHQLGIVHRDIKPDNVFLIDSDGEIFVKVLDFGVAKRAAEGSVGMTSTGAMLGTPRFMSPEQFLSAKHVDPRSDLWSVGVVTYYAVTGQPPFGGENLGQLCMAIEKGVFPPPSALRPDVPAAFDAWCLKALSQEQAARFQSAREMAQALAFALGLQSVTDTSPSLVPPLRPSAASWPAPQPPVAPAFPTAPAWPQPSGFGPAGFGMPQPTFPGTAVTFAGEAGTGGGRQRWPIVLGAGALALVAILGAGSFFVWRRSGAERGAVPPGGAATASAEPRPASSATAAPEPAAASGSGVAATGEAGASAAPTVAPAPPSTVATAASAGGSASARPAPASPALPRPDRQGQRARHELGL
ncbi:MAG: serine/threonine protein kinase [Deltaproteobacteria bacterium]|nr:serine/threonine protein kinase [Deltaproteobacteria bacterium]